MKMFVGVNWSILEVWGLHFNKTEIHVRKKLPESVLCAKYGLNEGALRDDP